jgi:probable rRNA maturation factor
MIHVTRKKEIPDAFSLNRIRSIAARVFSTRKLVGDATIVFTDNKSIQKYNKDFRDVDSPTDVLSFCSDENDPLTGRRYLGDIVISTEIARTQAKSEGRPVVDELTMLIVHGCLHLSGMDHTQEMDAIEMKQMQEQILRDLGVQNPSWPEEKTHW